MSVKIMTDVFEKSKTKGAARLVLLSLADTASDEGQCFPAIKTLARKAGVREQTTREYLHVFVLIGLVTVSARYKEDKQTSNLYEIHRDKIGQDEISGEMLAEVRPPSAKKSKILGDSVGDTPLTRGDRQGSHTGIPTPSHTGRDEPSVNHQKEPSDSSRKRERPEERALLETFSELAGIPIPKPVSEKEKKATAVRWYQPIRRMLELENGSSGEILRLAFSRMRSENLTISAPQSVEQVFIALHGERASQPQNRVTRNADGSLYV